MEVKPYKGDLSDLNTTMGIWINITMDSTLAMVGLAPICTSIPLYSGWNLVSYPGFMPQSVSNALSSISYQKVEGPDPGVPPYYAKRLMDFDTMMPGSGYWIMVDTFQVWTVCN
jgi:hypothetical protein